jgi:hypothetical protein
MKYLAEETLCRTHLVPCQAVLESMDLGSHPTPVLFPPEKLKKAMQLLQSDGPISKAADFRVCFNQWRTASLEFD